MVSMSDSRCGGPGSGVEVTDLLFIYFESSDGGIIGEEAEIRGSVVNCEERPLEGGGM